jgi:hypothetical protein
VPLTIALPRENGVTFSDKDFDRFLLTGAMTAQSLERYRHQYPRWRARLAARGHSEVPPFPAHTAGRPMTSCFSFAKERTRACVGAQQRNLTGVRPWKL